MNAANRWIFPSILILALLDFGGEGDYVQTTLSAITAGFLVLIAMVLHARAHRIEFTWIYFLYFPLMGLCALQSIPFGWHHHWVNDDIAILSMPIANGALSIDRSATMLSLMWITTLAGVAMIFVVLFRGDRMRFLANGIVAVGGGHALLALILLLGQVEWPSEMNLDHAKGSFVYTNHAASFWAGCLPLALLMASRFHGMWRWSCVALLSVSILLSGSRGGIIVSSLVCLPLAFSLLPRRNRWLWATTLSLAIGTWLVTIGMDDLSHRFGALRGKEGLTLNGRISLWNAAMPIAADSGAWGCGARTTTIAYRRSADTSFAPLTVDHLHSDPLEVLLEFGWGGAAVILAGIIITIFVLIPKGKNSEYSSDHRILWRGSALGLLALTIHSFGDFIFHNPAIDILTTSLACLCALSKTGIDTANVHRTWIRRLEMITIAALILAIILPTYSIVKDDITARNVGDFTYRRISRKLPLDKAGMIDEAIDHTANTISLAVLQSWIYRNVPSASNDRASGLAKARAALARAAYLSPADARAWTERAALFSETEDQKATSLSAHRALLWAPAWTDIQLSILNLSNSTKKSGIPDQDLAPIVVKLLDLDMEQPLWFFPLAASLCGTEFVSSHLSSTGNKLQKSGLSWLFRQGQLTDWLIAKRALSLIPVDVPLECAQMANSLYGSLPIRFLMPTTNATRRQIAEALMQCRIPIPAVLSFALVHDGLPWSIWAESIDSLNDKKRSEIEMLLRGELHNDWARIWTERMALVDRTMSGDWSKLDRNSDPNLLYALTQDIYSHLIPRGEAQRCRVILSRYRIPDLEILTPYLKSCWLYRDSQPDISKISNDTWAGLVIDGKWIGWTRGELDLSPLTGQGLHRIALLNPQ